MGLLIFKDTTEHSTNHSLYLFYSKSIFSYFVHINGPVHVESHMYKVRNVVKKVLDMEQNAKFNTMSFLVNSQN